MRLSYVIPVGPVESQGHLIEGGSVGDGGDMMTEAETAVIRFEDERGATAKEYS